MKIISHRGNLIGPNPDKENSIPYIYNAFEAGFDVEIDLRTKNNQLYLGHDYAQYPVTLNWLVDNNNKLLIHIKDIKAIDLIKDFDLHYFIHYNDSNVLTSQKFLWSHNIHESNSKLSIVPLIGIEDINLYLKNKKSYYGICTDFPILLQSK
jgi:glycerophosphoryl diester phosphodiesterase